MDDAAHKPVAASSQANQEKPEKQRREIPGNFSYTTTPGVLAKALQRMTVAERPQRITTDFVTTILEAPGGSGRPIIPILKKVGFVAADGSPTDRYAQFQSEGRRAQAALDALRTGWSELFRKNQYANKLDRARIEDLFKEITGLPKTEAVFRSIVATYWAFHEYAKNAVEGQIQEDDLSPPTAPQASTEEFRREVRATIPLALTNQINIVLPETTDINVYHAIFLSLRENLLQ